MNTKSWFAFLLATSTIGLVATSFNQSSNAEIVSQAEVNNSTATYSTDKINFYCGAISDKASGKKIPATLAYVPQRKENVAIIAWKSDYIPEWDAQTRCDTVSPKFQTFFENGRLEHLTTGVINGYDVVCAVGETGEDCTPENQLFQVKASSDPKAVLKGLTEINEGTSSEPIYQSSGDTTYVSIEQLLNVAPAIEEGDLTAN
jgi:hypothetical protein